MDRKTVDPNLGRSERPHSWISKRSRKYGSLRACVSARVRCELFANSACDPDLPWYQGSSRQMLLGLNDFQPGSQQDNKVGCDSPRALGAPPLPAQCSNPPSTAPDPYPRAPSWRRGNQQVLSELSAHALAGGLLSAARRRDLTHLCVLLGRAHRSHTASLSSSSLTLPVVPGPITHEPDSGSDYHDDGKPEMAHSP